MDLPATIAALQVAGFTGPTLAWLLLGLMVAYRLPAIIRESGGVINQAVKNHQAHQQMLRKLDDTCAAREKKLRG